MSEDKTTQEQEEILKTSEETLDRTVEINSKLAESSNDPVDWANTIEVKYIEEARYQLAQEAIRGYKPLTASDIHNMTEEQLIARNKETTDKQKGQIVDSEKAVAQPTYAEDAELKIKESEERINSPELQPIFRALNENNEKIKKAKEARKEAEGIIRSLEVADLYLAYNHLFSPASKLAFQNIVKSMVPQRKLTVLSTLKSTVYDRVMYLGVVAVGEDKVYEASQKLVEVINQLSYHGYVTGALCRLGMIKLAAEPHELPKYAIFSYPSVVQESVRKIKDMENIAPYVLIEGNPPTVEVR